MISIEIGVHEDHDLMREFVRIFMVLYLRNYLSQYVKIDTILWLDYMLTTNVKKSQLVQHIFMAVGIYQAIKM